MAQIIEKNGDLIRVVPFSLKLPEDLHLKLKIEAIKAKATLRGYIIRILEKEISKELNNKEEV